MCEAQDDQQNDFVEKLLKPFLQCRYSIHLREIEHLKSAQQRVDVLNCVSKICTPDQMRDALDRGRGRLVLRVWRNSARFWNLNNNKSSSFGESYSPDTDQVAKLARAEIAGYRFARQIFCSTSNPEKIPEVLYFSHDHSDQVDRSHSDEIWALLSFVGKGSAYFDNVHRCFDGSFVGEMVTIRYEFGFNEPHPRHGRVEEDLSQAYTQKILDQVVFPMHQYFFQNNTAISEVEKCSLCPSGNPITFKYMVEVVYHNAVADIESHMRKRDFTREPDEIAIRERYSLLLETIKECLDFISNDCEKMSRVPSVLIHCDLQPQNLVFWNHGSERRKRSIIPEVASVLDWEEACYADPRFEIMLLCRKVCANSNQANAIWKSYSNFARTFSHEIGSIKPWMRLEGIHSILTLTLQGMDLVGGGRSPWEKSRDLNKKIDRELVRLASQGLPFCLNNISDKSLLLSYTP